VELNADIDNNGFVQGDDWDKAMHAYAQNPADSIDRGTEFMFANDTLSNGAWDMQDSAAPSGSADDDVEKIVIRPMQYLDAGELWLEHPNIGGIEFYTTAECTEVAPVKSPTQPVVFSPASPIPQEGIVVYARAESIAFPPANPQVSGDLKLMIRPAGQQDAIEAARIKLTVVKKIGATKHHRAVIDYIREKNSKHYYNWIDTADQESVYVGYIGKKTLMDGIDPRHRFRTIYEAMTLDADAIIVGNYAGDDSGSSGWPAWQDGEIYESYTWNTATSHVAQPARQGYWRMVLHPSEPEFIHTIGTGNIPASTTRGGMGGLAMSIVNGNGGVNAMGKVDLSGGDELIYLTSGWSGDQIALFESSLSSGSDAHVYREFDGGSSTAIAIASPSGNLFIPLNKVGRRHHSPWLHEPFNDLVGSYIRLQTTRGRTE
jgi:hypothetical protein